MQIYHSIPLPVRLSRSILKVLALVSLPVSVGLFLSHNWRFWTPRPMTWSIHVIAMSLSKPFRKLVLFSPNFYQILVVTLCNWISACAWTILLSSLSVMFRLYDTDGNGQLDSDVSNFSYYILHTITSRCILIPISGNGLHNRSDDDRRRVHRLGDKGAAAGEYGFSRE